MHDLSDIRDDMVTTFSMSPDPIRKKCQYDYMLEEMRLMANDFLEEQRWKVHIVYILAHKAIAFFPYLHPRMKAREETLSDGAVLPLVSSSKQGCPEENRLVEQHKRIGHLLSEMVRDFWSKVHVVNEEFAQAHGMQCESAEVSTSSNNNSKEGGREMGIHWDSNHLKPVPVARRLFAWTWNGDRG